jgi:hypothetical protein
MENKNKKILYYLGGGILLSAVTAGAYFLWKKLTDVKLSPWLEEYLEEAKERISKEKDQKYSIETIAFLINLLTEIDDYLFQLNYSFLDEDRLEAFEHKQIYTQLCMQTIETKNEMYLKAQDYIEKALKINMKSIDEILRTQEFRNYKEAMKTCKKRYYKLPEIDKEKLKEAYLSYAKNKMLFQNFEQEQVYIMSRNPEYKMNAMVNIAFYQTKIKDELMIKYKIEEKYLEQLIEKHDLLKDAEVLRCYEDLNINS